MKKVLIGGFLSLLGTIWSLALVVLAENHPVSSWHTPPGRLFTSLAKMDLVLIFILSIVLLLTGICIMVVEFFRKEA